MQQASKRILDQDNDFLSDVITGLSAPQKTLPCKYLYDERGSQLFDTICDTEEYYPTRTEHQILDTHLPEMAEIIGKDAHVIEFGSGAGKKIRKLLTALPHPQSYTALDISEEILEESTQQLREEFPALDIYSHCADYTQAESLPDFDSVKNKNTVMFFPGSTISNFAVEDVFKFLYMVKQIIRPKGKLLIGVDLIKDKQRLEAAYDDEQGITAEFNKNLLTRINRELGANFEVGNFQHEARYNERKNRIEMHLVSLRNQSVNIAGRTFSFRENETIHTENSHKYSIVGFQRLAEAVKLNPLKVWTDKDELFSVHCLSAG